MTFSDFSTSSNKEGLRARRHTLGDLLTRTAKRYPDKIALIYGATRVTYRELETLTNQTARLFAADGIKRTTTVALLSKNNLDFVIAKYALAKLGAILVPINYMLTAHEMAYILQHAHVSYAIAAKDLIPALDAAIATADNLQIAARYSIDTTENISPSWKTLASLCHTCSGDQLETDVRDDDVAQILYTSGTESRPKGVMLTHQNLISQYVSCIVDGAMVTQDVIIHALPFYHSAQLNCFLGPGVYLGATGVILQHATPELILQAAKAEQATHLFCPPTVWIALLRQELFDVSLQSIAKGYYGAAIMPMEILKELAQRLPNTQFYNFYGQTEVAPLATVLKPEDQLRKLGSAGRPALNVETKIVDEFGHDVPPLTVGEIVHRTPHAMLGYLNDPSRTAEAFQDGWFHSGDLGYLDEDGYLTIVDRKKDMIKSGGVNVSSREVEETIYQFPGVLEVAVIGIPDDYWIEAVTAVIVMKQGQSLDQAALLTHCLERLAKFKVPKHVITVDQLPRNPSGKIVKRELREQYKTYAK
ncbi:fatty acyl-CoA synthetase [Sulfoacidibacillus thermotolerans]|uniref:Acyl-CoA synthetase n=1 Tax=Sulfoacidibacillus thermotolerans TaxID=1765684 RepID=A0A2U3D6M9_SULT2|nr:fatty acyl-CoA synthetase [Sulfoacidibacillus thermotolerans]PWI56936.1 acyl-CoA synthetase [Sulfoacidibacillus thermotolerans]